MVLLSISVAIGPAFHPPEFMFTEAERAAAITDIIVPDPFTKPKYRGDPRWVAWGSSLSFHSCNMFSGASPVLGRSSLNCASISFELLSDMILLSLMVLL